MHVCVVLCEVVAATDCSELPSQSSKCGMRALSLQAEIASLPYSEVLPAGQSVQTAAEVAPVAVEYLPISHLVQAETPDLAEKVPAAQLLHEAEPKEPL
jgi:hypothetical protein